MAPELVDEAVRACVEETNALNWLRRDVWAKGSAELATIGSAKKGIVSAIEAGRYSETLMDRLLDLEGREKRLKASIAEGPAKVPDVTPTSPNYTNAKSSGCRRRCHGQRSG